MFSLTSSSMCTPASWAASLASAALFFATNAAPLVALAIWIPARRAFWKRVNYFLFNICSIHFLKKILKIKMKKHEICFILFCNVCQTNLLCFSFVCPLVLVIYSREIWYYHWDGKCYDQNTGQRTDSANNFA